MRSFYLVESPLVKPSLSINEGFSTIVGSTIEGFQCINDSWTKNTDRQKNNNLAHLKIA